MFHNVKLAHRALFKSPVVNAVAVVSLARGIGANAAIFSLFHQMLLRPLPVEDPGALVNLAAPGVKAGSTSCNDATVGESAVVVAESLLLADALRR